MDKNYIKKVTLWFVLYTFSVAVVVFLICKLRFKVELAGALAYTIFLTAVADIMPAVGLYTICVFDNNPD